MKLRLEDNTLRLRLDPPEVTVFQEQGLLETIIPLGLASTDRLTYTLERDASAPALTVCHEADRIGVLVPQAVADSWTSTEEVSLRGTAQAFDNQVLHILVEKDLGCKH